MLGQHKGRFSMETHLKKPSGVSSILTVLNVTKEEAGIYECVVTNPFGKASHKIKFLVQGKSVCNGT
jgi:hypothetical protein